MYARCRIPVFTEPGARIGRQARSVTPQEALDGPRKPYEIERNQVLARCRVSDLQRIFTSRHASECSMLRAQLLSIEDEADQLRKKIEELEQQQKEILHGAQSKLEKEKEAAKKAEKEAADKAAGVDADEDIEVSMALQKMKSDGGEVPQESAILGTGKLQVSQGQGQDFEKSSTIRRQGMIFAEEDRKTHQEALVHQLEQTAVQQEQLIQELEVELQALDEQKEKHDKWIARLEGEVLDTEITKVRYRVRVQSSTARSQGLSELLKGSYEKMAALLKDRVAAEEESAKNDAILQYLQVVFDNNLQTFQDNRVELRKLMQKCEQNKELKDRVSTFHTILQREQNVADQLVQRTDELLKKLDAVQGFWMTIPAEVKSALALQEEAAAFKARRETVHPLNAIRTIKEGVSYLNAKQQILLRFSTELLDNSPMIVAESNPEPLDMTSIEESQPVKISKFKTAPQ